MDSNTAYKEFVRLANEDTDKVLTYDALYRCYAATYVVMTTSEKTSSEYSQATYNMTHILPFLPNAAAFYSRGMSAGNAVKFARAFVDVANLPAFADGGYRSQTAYAQLSYYAAASLVNQRQYEEAIPYLQSYIRSGEDKYRKTVFINLVKACAASNQYDLAIVTLEQATENYPTDYDFVSAAVNLCIDHNDNERLQHFVSKGLALQPEDATLLNIQGKLYEEKREFRQALSVYQKLQDTHPKALDVLKHLAINSYNLGVENYNKTLELREDPNVLFYEAEAKEYFTQAIDHLRNILISDPLSLKYTQALSPISVRATRRTSGWSTTNWLRWAEERSRRMSSRASSTSYRRLDPPWRPFQVPMQATSRSPWRKVSYRASQPTRPLPCRS